MNSKIKGFKNAHIELPEPVQRVPLSVRKAWARLIAKIDETNPLLCPHCGGEMKIVKFKEKFGKQSLVIQGILWYFFGFMWIPIYYYCTNGAFSEWY